MQKVFASSLLTSALAASTEGQLSAGSAASLRDAGHPLGNYSPYAGTYQFPVYYPSFHSISLSPAFFRLGCGSTSSWASAPSASSGSTSCVSCVGIWQLPCRVGSAAVALT